MKKGLTSLALIAALGGWWAVAGRSAPPIAPPKVNDVHVFMQAKLEHSKNLLEGLTQEDLDKVAKNAAALSLLSQASNWAVLQTPEYLHRSQEFRRITDRMTESAKKKDLDGAALGYLEMTMKCIDCHKYVRNVRMADNR